jgi:hypothetical protein
VGPKLSLTVCLPNSTADLFGRKFNMFLMTLLLMLVSDQ